MLSDILRYMGKNSAVTVDRIALSLKTDRSLVRMALDELVAKGRVECHTTGADDCGCGSCVNKCCSSVCGSRQIEVFRIIVKKGGRG